MLVENYSLWNSGYLYPTCTLFFSINQCRRGFTNKIDINAYHFLIVHFSSKKIFCSQKAILHRNTNINKKAANTSWPLVSPSREWNLDKDRDTDAALILAQNLCFQLHHSASVPSHTTSKSGNLGFCLLNVSMRPSHSDKWIWLLQPWITTTQLDIALETLRCFSPKPKQNTRAVALKQKKRTETNLRTTLTEEASHKYCIAESPFRSRQRVT